MNFLISVEVCSTPKLSKYVTFLAFANNAVQLVPIDAYSSRFLMYAPSFILDKLFLEKTPLNVGLFL